MLVDKDKIPFSYTDCIDTLEKEISILRKIGVTSNCYF